MTTTPSRSLPGPWKLTGALCPVAGPFAPLLFPGRLEEGVNQLAGLGYDAVELSVCRPSEIDAGWLAETLERHGMSVSSISIGRMYYEDKLSISSPDPQVRRACAARTAELVRLAGRFKSAVTIGGVRGVLPRDETAADLRLEAGRALAEGVAEAASLGVQVLVEPINRYETNFINNTEQALAFLEEAGLDSAGLLLDTFHMNIEEVSLPGAIRMAGSRLGYVHLADSNRRAPGCGHTDLPAVLDALVEIGYRGYLGMEILPWPDDYEAARLGLENTRRLVARFGEGANGQSRESTHPAASASQ